MSVGIIWHILMGKEGVIVLREYDEKLVEILNRVGETTMVNGVPVEIKNVPDDEIADRLDPRVYKREMEKQKEQTAQKLQQDNESGEKEAEEPSYDEMRKHMGGFNHNLNRVEIYARYIEVATSAGKVPVWIHYPRHMEGRRPAFLYVHGGGFFGGSPFTLENHCRLIAERADCVTFNIEYSLAPDAPYPIPCTQIYEVLCYVHDHGEEFSIDAEKIMMAGDSAGGNLTAVCAQMDRDKGTCYLKAEVLLYPKLIFSNYLLEGYQRDESAYVIAEEQKELLPGLIHLGSDESNAADEAVYVQGNYDITIPYISPAFGKKEGLPKTLLLLAEYDGLRLEGEFYAKQLMEAGVPVRVIRYRGVCHAFFDQLGILPQTEAALNEIVGLLLQL